MHNNIHHTRICNDKPVYILLLSVYCTVERRRLWVKTEVAITSLEQRQRPIKSKYLKDAYGLLSSAKNDAIPVLRNRAEMGNSKSSEPERGGASNQDSHLAYLDGGCLRNTV